MFAPAEALADDARKALSGATLLWAIASVCVVLLGLFGADISYEQALPVVALLAWLAAEINTRWPTRTPLAVCEGCGTVTTIRQGSLRRFWPWKHCASCGARLHYRCAHDHLLSLFPDQSPQESLFCARCGTPVPPRAFSATDFNERLLPLLQALPEGQSPGFYWSVVDAIVSSVPAGVAPSEEYWRVLETLVKRKAARPVDPDAERVALAMLAKLDLATSYWEELFDELIRLKSPRSSPSTILEGVSKMLAIAHDDSESVARIAADVTLATEEAKKKEHEAMWGAGL
jgi:hypothetical protein